VVCGWSSIFQRNTASVWSRPYEMKVVYSSRTVPTYQTMWYHNAEKQNLNAVWLESEVMKLVGLVRNNAFGV
jgi:hypothetical protein